MTIRILTSHPALRFVLGRTAPLGTTVRSPAMRRRSSRDVLYAIDIDSGAVGWEKRHDVLCAWLPNHVTHYGAQSVEINGQPVGADGAQLRRALSGRRRNPSSA